jgi:hypothetical protein
MAAKKRRGQLSPRQQRRAQLAAAEARWRENRAKQGKPHPDLPVRPAIILSGLAAYSEVIRDPALMRAYKVIIQFEADRKEGKHDQDELLENLARRVDSYAQYGISEPATGWCKQRKEEDPSLGKIIAEVVADAGLAAVSFDEAVRRLGRYLKKRAK